MSRHLRTSLEKVANTDALTSLPNRRPTLERAAKVLAESRRLGTGFTLALIDTDHFKMINDTFGHAAGDVALRELARAASSSIGAPAFVGRWGGEEFLAVFPTDAMSAAGQLKQLRHAAHGIQMEGDRRRGLRFSCGVVSDMPDRPSFETLVAHADTALYHAKAAGRDRISSFEEMRVA